MNALEFMRELDGPDFETPGTVDNFKFGDRGREVRTVAVCMTATPDVIKEAVAIGADLIITHEPTYHTHTDEIRHTKLVDMKIAAVEAAGIPLCRYHDHMHFAAQDMISLGFLDRVGWRGEFDGEMGFTLDEEMSPLEIARDIEAKCGVAHCRIVGRRDGKVKNVGLFLGHRGGECWDKFKNAESDIQLAIGGEWCEWADGEPIRDGAEFGLQMTAIMMGHGGSERDGMRYLAKKINERFGERGITAHFIDAGELYSYTDK
ncbi:MAG: Nif3-like dinuclear metal center hexameric protein [Clostridia bacterium]|nr:Nif3-like dinuclear metal center hexameric protein [Clostridia bacterium]